MSLQLTEVLRYFELLVQAALLVVFWRRGLIGRYRWFYIYIAARLLRSLALIGIDNHTLLYARTWAATEPVLWVCQTLALVELLVLVLEYFPKVGKFTRAIVGSSFAFGILLSGCVTILRLPGTAHMLWWFYAVMAITQCIAWLSAIVLITQDLLFTFMPLPMRPNVQVHRWLLGWYIGVAPGLAIFFALLKNTRLADTANLCLQISDVVCILLWILLLRPAGEIKPEIDDFSGQKLATFIADLEAGRSVVWRALFG